MAPPGFREHRTASLHSRIVLHLLSHKYFALSDVCVLCCVGQVTAQELWRHLGSENTELHHRTAELFYTLHQVTPRAWICEDAIGIDLISDDEVSDQ